MTCIECGLIYGNKNNGFRFGNAEAELVILRPYPSRQECQGKGDTRQNQWLLNRLKEVGFKEDNYHVVNMVNCYPNRKVSKRELQHCADKLNTIIKKKPVIIMTLGVDAYNYLTGYNYSKVDSITRDLKSKSNLHIVANYTVGQAMQKEEIKYKFKDVLYRVKNLYRLNIDLNI